MDCQWFTSSHLHRLTRGYRIKTNATFAAILFLFITIEFSFPRFPDIDEAFFKSAGRNLSAGGSFAAPELENFLHLDPPIQHVYFAHPPVYSWLFAQAVRLFGFSWKVCVGYDAMISALLALCVYGLTLRAFRRTLPEISWHGALAKRLQF